MRVQDGYSVAVNFRRTGGTLTANLQTALSKYKRLCYEKIIIDALSSCLSAWPIGFLVREILESTKDYHIAVEQLAQSSIIAPCYLTICGISQSRTIGTLLTRRQTSEENR